MAYDISGRIPDEPSKDPARSIGKAKIQLLGPGPIALGRDTPFCRMR